MRREIDVYIELCIKKLKEFGYSEDDARKLCEADLSNLKIK